MAEPAATTQIATAALAPAAATPSASNGSSKKSSWGNGTRQSAEVSSRQCPAPSKIAEVDHEAAKHSLALMAIEAKFVANMKKKLKPQRGALPGTPMHASLKESDFMEVKDASPFERARDAILLFFLRHTSAFNTIAGIAISAVVGWGGFIVYVFLNHFGWVNAYSEDEANYWTNVCIHVFTAIFSYINSLAIPWRVSIAHHLWQTRRDNSPGRDFYGRKTDAQWFHLSVRDRKIIAIGLNLGWVLHWIQQVARWIWSSHEASNLLGPAILINSTFAGSIIFPALAGSRQNKVQKKLASEKPDMFPQTIAAHLGVAIRDWRTGNAPEGLVKRIRHEFSEHQREVTRKDPTKRANFYERQKKKSDGPNPDGSVRV